MLFTISLKVWLKKANTVVMWWKNILTKNDVTCIKNLTKFWICDNAYVNSNVKIRNHRHITRKYRNSTYRDCNIKVKLNHKIPVAFHNLKIMIDILLYKD